MAELLGSADGEVAVAMTGGSTNRLLVRLANLDVATPCSPGCRGGQKEDIRCLVGDMTASGGVLKPRTPFSTRPAAGDRPGHHQPARRAVRPALRTEPKDGSLLALRGPLYLGGSFAAPV